MNNIEQEISLQEIKKVNRFNKEGGQLKAYSIHFISNNKELELIFKGVLAERFKKSDYGLKAKLKLSFDDIKQKKIIDFKEQVK